jgi:hypothetical protein
MHVIPVQPMETKRIDTHVVTISMAGNLATAKSWLRAYCYRVGLCVTVTPTTFIYTGGEEEGFVVGLLNYPRFPKTLDEIREHATLIAKQLLHGCQQRSVLVVDAERTEWFHVEPPGAKQP